MPSKPNPYLTIWIKSRSTFESFFYERRFSDSIYGLPFLIYGISMGLNMGPEIYLAFDKNPAPQYILLTYVLASLFGIGATYLVLGFLNPWITKLIGKIWNGKATRAELANVNALSTTPYCLILVYQLIMLATGTQPILSDIHTGFLFVLWILSFRLLIIGIAVTQNFSYGIALLNIFLAYLPLAFIVLLTGS